METALTVDHLTKSFGGRKAVDDVSFALPEGAFLSVFGPNGAGKTTLLRMLATLSRPTEGTVTLAGIDVKEEPERVREAIGLIRSAVENPDVFVLASAAEAGEIDPFFFDLLEPLSVIDIDFPTVSERDDIWMEIAREHPSLRGIDRASLVRYSAQMPRYDMYMAAREAIEEAYKASLVARRYLPVTADNLYDKLAAYQPLDSDEYRALEEAVVSDFRRELEHLEDLLDREEGN